MERFNKVIDQHGNIVAMPEPERHGMNLKCQPKMEAVFAWLGPDRDESFLFFGRLILQRIQRAT